MTSDPVLVSYFAAYALVLATPGPNMLVIGALAALKGVGSVLPIAFGLGIGGAALGAAMYFMAGLIPAGSSWHILECLISSLLLAWLGVRLIRAASTSPSNAPTNRSEQSAQFALGLSTALSNPVTLAFFASQMIGPLSDRGIGIIGPLLLITGLLALAKALVVATMFSHPVMRQRLVRWFRPASIGIGLSFLALATLRMMPVLKISM
jgi:threonine/homoserine/homoserine lactone efflux protein